MRFHTVWAMSGHWECCSKPDIGPAVLRQTGHLRRVLHPFNFGRRAAFASIRAWSSISASLPTADTQLGQIRVVLRWGIFKTRSKCFSSFWSLNAWAQYKVVLDQIG